MATSDTMFIKCDNLVKIYTIGEQEVFALQGLDLRVAKGEFMAIVGASGSGKSTLMNILGGLDRPTAGTALVDGLNLLKLTNSQLNDYRRRLVGFVWQQTSRNLLPYISALKNVELLMTLAGKPLSEKKTWARNLLEAVGLGARMHHRLAQLSGGEQQRVAIAVALANKPILLLADEPTGELDSNTAGKILDIFRQLCRDLGITIIVVSHDPSISSHVDRVVAIQDGKTSTERIRTNRPKQDHGKVQEEDYNEYVVLDSAGRLQIPPEYREKLNIGNRVELDLLEQGILIRPVASHELQQAEDQGDTEK